MALSVDIPVVGRINVEWVPLAFLTSSFLLSLGACIWLLWQFSHRGIFKKCESIVRQQMLMLALANLFFCVASSGNTFLDFAPGLFIKVFDMSKACDYLFMGKRRGQFFYLSCELLIATSFGALAMGSRTIGNLRIGLFMVAALSILVFVEEDLIMILGDYFWFASYNPQRQVCEVPGTDYLTITLFNVTFFACCVSCAVVAARAKYYSTPEDEAVWKRLTVFPIILIAISCPGIVMNLFNLWSRDWFAFAAGVEGLGGFLNVLAYTRLFTPLGLPREPVGYTDDLGDWRSYIANFQDPERGRRALAAAGLQKAQPAGSHQSPIPSIVHNISMQVTPPVSDTEASRESFPTMP